jgi:hypothetical protein
MNGDGRTLVDEHLWTDVDGWKGLNRRNRIDVDGCRRNDDGRWAERCNKMATTTNYAGNDVAE